MKNQFLFAVPLFTMAASFAQPKPSEYSVLVKKADSLYEAKDYKNSGLTYSKAFSKTPKAQERDRYNAACSWSLAKEIDSSFVQLHKIAANGYDEFDHASRDTDLDNLHTDKRWKPWLDKVQENWKIADAKLDRKLMAQLEQVLKDDQELRKQLPTLEKQYGLKSEEVKKHWELIDQKDDANLVIVSKILDEKGFPSQDVIGGYGSSALFLVIQHADQKTREKYLPMLREAALKGDLPNSSFALLKDRTDLGQGKKQTYGSQIYTDPDTGISYVRWLEDPENVDARRASVGLEPIANYVRRWNVVWDAKTYLNDLPKLEAIEKKMAPKK